MTEHAYKSGDAFGGCLVCGLNIAAPVHRRSESAPGGVTATTTATGALYVLVMNPMTGRTEAAQPVAIGTREELLALVTRETVEPYRDEASFGFGGSVARSVRGTGWYKSFRKGGPLEWFNKLDNSDGTPGLFGHGIHPVISLDETIQKAVDYARATWLARFGSLPFARNL